MSDTAASNGAVHDETIRVLTPQGENALRYLNPVTAVLHLARLWPIIFQFTRREVRARYRTTHLGFIWPILHPLVMLLVYTYVFAMAFQAKWGREPDEGFAQFAVALFAGLIAYNLFAESLGMVSGFASDSVQYIKKMVFPVEIFPVVKVAANSFQALVNLLILLPAVWIVHGAIPPTAPLILLVLLPLAVLTLGLGYFVAALGVFARDVTQTVSIFVLIMFFVTPIFYPPERLPEFIEPYYRVNLLAIIVENCRRVAVFGEWPEWGWLALVYGVALLVLALGLTFFQKSRKAFSDVL